MHTHIHTGIRTCIRTYIHNTCIYTHIRTHTCRYEAEFFQQQVALEADKATAMAQARALQDEAVRLQVRACMRLCVRVVVDECAAVYVSLGH